MFFFEELKPRRVKREGKEGASLEDRRGKTKEWDPKREPVNSKGKVKISVVRHNQFKREEKSFVTTVEEFYRGGTRGKQIY